MFKVGDKVRVIDAAYSPFLTNTVCTVRSSGKDYTYIEGCLGGWKHSRFKLVEQTPTARSNDPTTSKGKRKVNKYEQAVLDCLQGGAMNGKEIARFTEHPLNCITPRFAPLRRKGLIKALKVEVGRGVGQLVKRDKQIVWVLA